jgi:HSP20 family protein
MIPWRRGSHNLLREEPFPGTTRLFQTRMNDLFERLFREPFSGLELTEPVPGNGWFRVDVAETDKEITLTADLPGMEEKDLDISISDGVITIQGERKEEKEEKDEKRHYRYVERSFGSFSRSLELPSTAEADKIAATFKKGVLTVKVPKKAEAKAKKIPVRTG